MDYMDRYLDLCSMNDLLPPIHQEEFTKASELLGCFILIHLCNTHRDLLYVYQAVSRDRFLEMKADDIAFIRDYMRQECESQCRQLGWNYRTAQYIFDEDDFTHLECRGIKCTI